MSRKRRQHDAQFKLRVALEATKGLKTISQIASEYNLHPNLVSSWKKQLLPEEAASSAAIPPGSSVTRRRARQNCTSRSGGSGSR